MENKHLIWIIPIALAVGIVIGIFILPKKIDINFQVVNSTQDWLDDGLYKISNYTYNYNWTNVCCYPMNCPQAEKNPKDCTCIYPVYCGKFYNYSNNNSFFTTNFYNLTLVFKN